MNHKTICFILILISITQSTTINLKCTYRHANWGSHFSSKIYECRIDDDLNITAQNVTVATISGEHDFLNSDEDVTGLHMQHKTVHFLLQGFAKIFKNLLGLSVQQCGLKALTQTDLKAFPKLQHLFIVSNDLTALEGSLFKYNPELFFINFDENKIQEIDGKIFSALKSLRTVSMLKNSCIDTTTSGSTALSQLIKIVRENCWKSKGNEAESEEEVTEQAAVTITERIATTVEEIEVETAKKMAETVGKKMVTKRNEIMRQIENERPAKWVRYAVLGAIALAGVIVFVIAVKIKRRSRNVSEIPD